MDHSPIPYLAPGSFSVQKDWNVYGTRELMNVYEFGPCNALRVSHLLPSGDGHPIEIVC